MRAADNVIRQKGKKVKEARGARVFVTRLTGSKERVITAAGRREEGASDFFSAANAKFKVRPGLGRFIHSRWKASVCVLPDHVAATRASCMLRAFTCNFSLFLFIRLVGA